MNITLLVIYFDKNRKILNIMGPLLTNKQNRSDLFRKKSRKFAPNFYKYA